MLAILLYDLITPVLTYSFIPPFLFIILYLYFHHKSIIKIRKELKIKDLDIYDLKLKYNPKLKEYIYSNENYIKAYKKYRKVYLGFIIGWISLLILESVFIFIAGVISST